MRTKAAESPRNRMQINLTPDSSLLWIMAIFLANYLVVRKYFLKPVNDILVFRDREAQDAQSLYESSLASFQAATSEVETKLHEAKRKGAEVREGLRAEAMQQRTKTVEQTRAEAESMLKDAAGRLAADVNEAREKVVRDAATLAKMAADRIAGRAL